MKRLFWDENAEPSRDSDAFGRANCLKFTDVSTCNYTIVSAALLLVIREHIKPFIFVYKDIEYEVNEYGVMPEFNNSVDDTDIDINLVAGIERLKLAIKKRKSKMVK